MPPVNGPVFRFAQPVLLGIRFTNETGGPITVPPGFLDQKAGFLEIAIRRENVREAEAAAVFHPITQRCVSAAAASAGRVLSAGEVAEDNLNLTFGADGFAFAEPGNYSIIAYLVLELNRGDYLARSAALRIRVASPQGDGEEAAALDLLEPAPGACLALGGSAALEGTASRLMEVADRLSGGGKNRRHPVATGIYRALAFHYTREYPRFAQGTFCISPPKPEEVRHCRERLDSRSLGILDPITRAATSTFPEYGVGRQIGTRLEPHGPRVPGCRVQVYRLRDASRVSVRRGPV